MWSVSDALETYGVPCWGQGYFGIGDDGHVVVHPDKDPSRSIDLKALVDELKVRGLTPPILLRFTDILGHRIREMAGAFRTAIEENEYEGGYRHVYPVKTNQQRHVVEEIRDFGSEFGFGLEAGSKPELLAVLALTAGRDVPVVCNGFKDDEFIETVILAQKIGQNVIPVVEKYSELELITKHAKAHGVSPTLGMRVKIAARGAGRWELSGGARSKFGLFMPEVRQALAYLEENDLLDGLDLLHFHLGSQITNIGNVKNAVTELTRIYVQVKKAGARLTYLDVGGGLGVDYDGSRTNWESSVNYTLREYASDVVSRVKSICDEADVEHPTIISESGRSVVAYHSVLVFDVLGRSRFDAFDAPEELPEPANGDDQPIPLVDLLDRLKEMNHRNCLEYYHDAVQAFDEAINLFKLGYLDLEQRDVAERLFWAICTKVLKITLDRVPVPEEVQSLRTFLADTYFGNFSVFQSLPDSWAVGQQFPILPIHRLNERPTRHGILGDITCDSDGKISQFTHIRDDKKTLELHPLDDRPYYLGAFLVGAYQEILGDMHNLLGDTHAVHVTMDDEGQPVLSHIVHGDTVREVLAYVEYNADELLNVMRREVDRAVKQGRLSLAESTLLLRFYESGLSGYTYLEETV
ncbi:MAG: biosynthetic arginine decarboxylase [Planctomycetota bacterium]